MHDLPPEFQGGMFFPHQVAGFGVFLGRDVQFLSKLNPSNWLSFQGFRCVIRVVQSHHPKPHVITSLFPPTEDQRLRRVWNEQVIKKIEAEAAEEEEVAAAMKMNRFLPARKPFWRSLWWCVCKDSETKKTVIVRSSFWSSFWAAFHFRIFEVC